MGRQQTKTSICRQGHILSGWTLSTDGDYTQRLEYEQPDGLPLGEATHLQQHLPFCIAQGQAYPFDSTGLVDPLRVHQFTLHIGQVELHRLSAGSTDLHLDGITVNGVPQHPNHQG